MVQAVTATTLQSDGTCVEAPARVCLGAIAGAHGVRGAVRIKPFTAEPESVGSYGELSDESGQRRFSLQVLGVSKGMVIAKLSGVEDREAAEALRGLRLYVARTALPDPEEDEFYHADLIGLPVETEDGQPFGRVRALYDFGAGDVIEVDPAAGGQPVVLPFTRESVPVVDLRAGRIVVVPPEGLLPAHGRKGERVT